MSNAELIAEALARHYRLDGETNVCARDDDDWPCVTKQLADALAATSESMWTIRYAEVEPGSTLEPDLQLLRALSNPGTRYPRMSNAKNIYTPDTEEVEEAYANGVWNDGVGRAGPEVDTEFQRWMVAHDSAIRNSALEEAAVIAEGLPGEDGEAVPDLSKKVYMLAVHEVAAAIRAAKEVTP